jgi:hypothetical protein
METDTYSIQNTIRRIARSCLTLPLGIDAALEEMIIGADAKVDGRRKVIVHAKKKSEK